MPTFVACRDSNVELMFLCDNVSVPQTVDRVRCVTSYMCWFESSVQAAVDPAHGCLYATPLSAPNANAQGPNRPQGAANQIVYRKSAAQHTAELIGSKAAQTPSAAASLKACCFAVTAWLQLCIGVRFALSCLV